MDNRDIQRMIRGAMNDAFVMRTRAGMPADKKSCEGHVMDVIRAGIPPSPAAWPFQKDDFPFVTGSGGWIGEALREMDPDRYTPIGDCEDARGPV